MKKFLLSFVVCLFAASAVGESKYLRERRMANDLQAGVDFSAGDFPEFTMIHKFGRNEAVGTTVEPICYGGIYRTPTNAVALEVVSNNTNDTGVVSGSGAQTFFVEGLDGNYNLISETVTLNGTTAVDLTNTYTRVFRAYVASSGTYATQSAGSQAGILTLRVDGGGDTWMTIDDVSVFPKSQSQVGVYSVPAGYSAYIVAIHIHVETSKPASIFLFQRQNIDDVTAPYSPMRLVQEWDGVDGAENLTTSAPIGPFPEKTDVGFMGKVASTSAAVSVDFEIILVKN